MKVGTHDKITVLVCVLVAQSCPTLWDPMDCSPPGSSVHGILQTKILERVAIPFSRGSSRPRNRNWVSCIASRFFTAWTTRWGKLGPLWTHLLLTQVIPSEESNVQIWDSFCLFSQEYEYVPVQIGLTVGPDIPGFPRHAWKVDLSWDLHVTCTKDCVSTYGLWKQPPFFIIISSKPLIALCFLELEERTLLKQPLKQMSRWCHTSESPALLLNLDWQGFSLWLSGRPCPRSPEMGADSARRGGFLSTCPPCGCHLLNDIDELLPCSLKESHY